MGEVTPDSPAAHADLHRGDIIVEINGPVIGFSDANQLRLKIGMMAPNSSAAMKVMRDGKALNISMTLAEYPSKVERAGLKQKPGSAEEGAQSADKSLEGVSVRNLTPEAARELKLPESTPGVVVAEVSPSSRAADAGLQPGDVIQQVNHQPVANTRDFSGALVQAG